MYHFLSHDVIPISILISTSQVPIPMHTSNRV